MLIEYVRTAVELGLPLYCAATVPLALVLAMRASAAGRNPWEWALATVLVGPVALFCWAFRDRAHDGYKQEPSKQQARMITCPKCRKRMPRGKKFCMCGHYFKR